MRVHLNTSQHYTRSSGELHIEEQKKKEEKKKTTKQHLDRRKQKVGEYRRAEPCCTARACPCPTKGLCLPTPFCQGAFCKDAMVVENFKQPGKGLQEN